MTASPLYLEDRISRLEQAGDQMWHALVELYRVSQYSLSGSMDAGFVQQTALRAVKDWQELK